jgi:hypothetical protein
MDVNTKQTREPIPGGMQLETDHTNSGTTYWGILCRTCHALVAFDTCPYISFGPGAASMKPGAIRCGLGHNHIYFPRDFGFLPSVDPVSIKVMRENREIFKAINPSEHAA